MAASLAVHCPLSWNGSENTRTTCEQIGNGHGMKSLLKKLNRWSETVLRVTDAEYAGAYRLRLAFSDGTNGIADLSSRLSGPIFQPLNDPNFFQAFQLTDHTVTWPNGADFAPEYLHDLVAQPELANPPMNEAADELVSCGLVIFGRR